MSVTIAFAFAFHSHHGHTALGAMAQSPSDADAESAPRDSDLRTAAHLGARVAAVAAQMARGNAVPTAA